MSHNFPVIIVGVGSIGQRHAKILTDLGAHVTTVSRRLGIGDVDTLVDGVFQAPESLLVIANETGQHMASLNDAIQAGHTGPVAIEKPICRTIDEVTDQVNQRRPLWVTYNMRYLPVIRELRNLLAKLKEPVLSVQMTVGQFLGDWRPERNVDDSYSSHAAAGGGVLRDLSHELDLIIWRKSVV